jgi:hypothetical protein
MRYSVILLTILLGGCGSHDSAPLLAKRDLLSINSERQVRVIGIARYLQATGPSIASDDFELRVYPRHSWGPSLDGQRIEVTGTLHDSSHTTPPDPSLEPGEYWMSDVHWKHVPEGDH